MSKDTYYFSHDYNPVSDPKIEGLISKYGYAGYGFFWRLVEMLHQEENHKLPLKEYIFIASAKHLQADLSTTMAMLQYMIDVLELFRSDGSFIWSERVHRNVNKRKEIKAKKQEAGRKGGLARSASKKNDNSATKELPPAKQNEAPAKQVVADAKQKLPKERKGKENLSITHTNAHAHVREGPEIQDSLSQKHLDHSKPIKYEFPSFEKFKNQADMLAFDPRFTEHLFYKCESKDWKDGSGQPIANWVAWLRTQFSWQDQFLSKLNTNNTHGSTQNTSRHRNGRGEVDLQKINTIVDQIFAAD